MYSNDSKMDAVLFSPGVYSIGFPVGLGQNQYYLSRKSMLICATSYDGVDACMAAYRFRYLVGLVTHGDIFKWDAK